MKSRFDKKKCFLFSCRVYVKHKLIKIELKNCCSLYSDHISETVKAPTHLLENFRQVPLVELVLLLRLRRTWVHTVFIGVCFSFLYSVVCSSSIYEFWIPHWYLQALLDLRYSIKKNWIKLRIRISKMLPFYLLVPLDSLWFYISWKPKEVW